MKIETTEAMRRFNRAVERADFEFGSVCDCLDVERLIASLRQCQLHVLAHELEAAAAGIDYLPHLPKIKPIEFSCPHSWRHTGTSSDGMADQFTCRLCGKVEVK